MSERVRVGVMGAGSVGCFLGAQLAMRGELDVVLVGRQRVMQEIARHGLRVQNVGEREQTVNSEYFEFSTEADSLRDCDVVLCCVKSAQSEEAAGAMAEVLADGAIVVSMQNGLRNADVLRQALGRRRVLAGIVDFNVVSQGDGLFERTMSGPLRVERCPGIAWRRVAETLRRRGISLLESDDIIPEQWTKLLVNLNNAVSALSGAATPALLRSPGYRRVIATIMEEGIDVLRAARIRPAKLRGIPVAWMPRILRLPTPIVRVVTRAQMKVASEARSSMWEDLERRRSTEVDYLNGEVVALAERVGDEAPFNQRITELVHDAERLKAGSPGLSGAELWTALQGKSGPR